jgi:hypothetical protein
MAASLCPVLYAAERRAFVGQRLLPEFDRPGGVERGCWRHAFLRSLADHQGRCDLRENFQLTRRQPVEGRLLLGVHFAQVPAWLPLGGVCSHASAAAQTAARSSCGLVAFSRKE